MSSRLSSTTRSRLAAGAGIALLGAAFVGVAGMREAGNPVIIPDNPNFSIDQEPILIYEVSGFGLGGPLHQRMAVYSDGLATFGSGGSPVDDGQGCFIFVGPEVAADLATDLRAAGAFELTDMPAIVSDLPLTTVTVFRPMGNGWSRSRSFSYLTPITPQATDVHNVIIEFLYTFFPNGVCNDGGW